MKVDVYVLGQYRGRIDVSKDSLVGKLALRDYEAIPAKVKELCKQHLLVTLADPPEVEDE